MTGSQLKAFRQSYDWSQREVADRLIDVTDVTVSRWEAAAGRDIPNWASEKLLSSVELRIPMAEMRAMLDLARSRNESFDDILHAALREYIHRYARAEGIQIAAPAEKRTYGSTRPGVPLDEAMAAQTARNRKLIEQAAAPPSLHVVPGPEQTGEGESHASRPKKRKAVH